MWKQDVAGSLLQILCSKLLATRRVIRESNKNFFGNVFGAVHTAEKEVLRAEIGVENDESEEAQIELNKAQANLRHALLLEE